MQYVTLNNWDTTWIHYQSIFFGCLINTVKYCHLILKCSEHSGISDNFRTSSCGNWFYLIQIPILHATMVSFNPYQRYVILLFLSYLSLFEFDASWICIWICVNIRYITWCKIPKASQLKDLYFSKRFLMGLYYVPLIILIIERSLFKCEDWGKN